MCGHIHVRLPHCVLIFAHFFHSLMCGWTAVCQIHACMHACSHIHRDTNLPMRTKWISTVNENTLAHTYSHTHMLAYTRDTDRQTVLIMCAAGCSLLLSLLLVDNSARIDFDSVHICRQNIHFSLLLPLLSAKKRTETKEKRRRTWACVVCLNSF